MGMRMALETWFDAQGIRPRVIGEFEDSALMEVCSSGGRGFTVVHTVVDAPQGFSNSVPAVWEATHPRYALVRLHGRNTETWNVKGATAASDRFNYDYPEGELDDLATRAARLAKEVEETHVVFNNNMEDQGQRNARTMIELLRRHKARVEDPAPAPEAAQKTLPGHD